MRLNLLALGLALLMVLSVLTFTSLSVHADSRVINDISWPNCGEKLNSLSASGIVGVNGGLDFSGNRCLSDQSQLFHNSYSLYLNTGYPGLPDALKYINYPKKCQFNNPTCLAYNWGYNDVLYSIKYANQQNAHSFVWWLDVETENSWSSNYTINRQILIGMANALAKNTFMPTIGFYSYPVQWQILTGDWKNHYPAWVASGSAIKAVAVRYCSMSFNGGNVWLSQYTINLDNDYVCLDKGINNFKII